MKNDRYCELCFKVWRGWNTGTWNYPYSTYWPHIQPPMLPCPFCIAIHRKSEVKTYILEKGVDNEITGYK